MKYGFVRTALIFPEIKPGAVDFNKNELLRTFRLACERSPEIVLAGRLSLTGYSCGGMFFYNNLLQGCIDALASLVAETQSLASVFVFGLPLKMSGKIYDCSAVVFAGRILALIPHDNSDPVFSCYPDGALTYIRIDGRDVPFGKDVVFYNNIMDYSIGFFDAPKSFPHPEIVLRPLALPKTMGSRKCELELARAVSRGQNSALITVSAAQTVAARGLFDDFGTVVEMGKEIHQEDPKRPNVLFAEIDIGGISHTRTLAGGDKNTALPSGKNAKAGEPFATSHESDSFPLTVEFACNNNDSVFTRKIDSFPLCPSTPDEAEEALEILQRSIKNKLDEVGLRRVIFGLSGGLDSAFVLLLCSRLFAREAMPMSNIIAVTMPTPHTSKSAAKNAKNLIESTGIATLDIPIMNAVKKHLKDIDHEEIDVVFENAQARERAQILLDLSNKYNALMLGTGDLSELCLGFTTYGGDQIAHFNPNGGLTKTAIRAIVKYAASTSDNKELKRALLDVLKTPISPELLPEQQTETILGSYALHDFFLYSLLHKGYDAEKTLFLSQLAFPEKQRSELFSTLSTFCDRFFKNRFKHNFSCDSPAVMDFGLSEVLQNIRSGFSPEQWQKELANLKN